MIWSQRNYFVSLVNKEGSKSSGVKSTPLFGSACGIYSSHAMNNTVCFERHVLRLHLLTITAEADYLEDERHIT